MTAYLRSWSAQHGRALISTVVIVAIIAGVVFGITVSLPRGSATAQSAPTTQSPSNLEFFQTLTALGLSPDAGAASGLTGAHVEALFTAAKSHPEEGRAFLDALRQLETARQVRSAFRDEARRFGVTPALRTNLDSAKTQFETAEAQRAGAEAALKSIVLGIVESAAGAEPARRLGLMMANRAREVPDQYRLASMSENEWATLETAMVRRRMRPDGALTLEEQALLSRLDAQTDVSQARYDLETGVSSTSLAFANALQSALDESGGER